MHLTQYPTQKNRAAEKDWNEPDLSNGTSSFWQMVGARRGPRVDQDLEDLIRGR